ncbi:MAG: tetratricopeptide repeat protein [Bacteroidota bacterium]
MNFRFIFAALLLFSFGLISSPSFAESNDKALEELEALLVRARSNLSSPGDSSLHLLKEALDIAHEADLPMKEADAGLLLAYFYHNRAEYALALEYIEGVLSITLQHQLLRKHCGALQAMADIQRKLGNEQKALELYLRSMDIARDNDFPTIIGNGYLNIAPIYFTDAQFDAGLDASRRALTFYREAGDSIRIGIILHNLGTVYQDLDSLETALRYYEEASVIFHRKNAQKHRSVNLLLIGTIHSMQKAYSKALSAIRKALQIAEEGKFQAEVCSIHIQIADLFFVMGQYDSCRIHADIALSQAIRKKHASRERKSRLLLFRLFSQHGEKVLADLHYDRWKHLQDSLYEVKRTEDLTAARIRFETEEKDVKIALLQAESHAQTRFRNLLIFAAGLLFLLLLLLLNRLQLARKLLQHEKTRLRLEGDIQEKEKARIDAEQELAHHQLTRELDQKNRELTSTAMNLMHKNEALSDVLDKLACLQKHLPTEYAQQVRNIANLIPNGLRMDKDWEYLKLHFEEVHPDFFQKLRQKFPGLTESELKHCAYIRLNLSNKAVARLVHISDRSVQMARYRIKKKLNLLREDSLSAFIGQI